MFHHHHPRQSQHTPIVQPAVTRFANLLHLLPLPGVVQARGAPLAKAPVKMPAAQEVYGLDGEGR
jgi:hypothetical protein